MVTEYSVRSDNTGVPIIREIMAATTMSSLFVAFFTLLASTFRTRAALQAEILALRHQLAVFQENAPRRLRPHRCDRLWWVVLPIWSSWQRCLQGGSARHGPPLAPPSSRLALILHFIIFLLTSAVLPQRTTENSKSEHVNTVGSLMDY